MVIINKQIRYGVLDELFSFFSMSYRSVQSDRSVGWYFFLDGVVGKRRSCIIIIIMLVAATVAVAFILVIFTYPWELPFPSSHASRYDIIITKTSK